MWNPDNFDATFYENDPFERFTSRGGHASCSSAGLGVVTGNRGENREKSTRKIEFRGDSSLKTGEER
jgi:hypothetical protein